MNQDNNPISQLQNLNLEDQGEVTSLRSLLMGMCDAVSSAVQCVDGFSALLADDIEAAGGNVEYLERIAEELSTIKALADSSSAVISESGANGDDLPISTLVSGVTSRAERELPTGSTVNTDLEEELIIRTDAFAFQSLLLDVLMRFSRSATDSKHGWVIASRSLKLSNSELHALKLPSGSDVNNAYTAVAILPDDMQFPEMTKLREFSRVLTDSNDLKLPMLLTAKWLGTARLLSGGMYYLPGTVRPNMLLLFPAVEKRELSTKDVLELAEATHRPNGEPRTILLVDDEDMIWDVLIDMLQSMGYNVLLASDGKEAVSIYGSNLGNIDLVILDMIMPKMGGKETFFILKELDPNVRVLASSGYVSQEEIQDVMEAGAAGFLRKPYRMTDLAKKIEEILRQ